MWRAKESTESSITKAVESLANISIFDEFDESKQLGRSFVKMVKVWDQVMIPVVPPRESSLL